MNTDVNKYTISLDADPIKVGAITGCAIGIFYGLSVRACIFIGAFIGFVYKEYYSNEIGFNINIRDRRVTAQRMDRE